MKNILSPILEDHNFQGLDNFDRIFDNLISAPKVPRYAYCIPFEKCIPDKRIHLWKKICDSDISGDPEDLDLENNHQRNFKCTTDSRVFHNAITFKNFLYKMKLRDSPDCVLCKNVLNPFSLFL